MIVCHLKGTKHTMFAKCYIHFNISIRTDYLDDMVDIIQYQTSIGKLDGVDFMNNFIKCPNGEIPYIGRQPIVNIIKWANTLDLHIYRKFWHLIETLYRHGDKYRIDQRKIIDGIDLPQLVDFLTRLYPDIDISVPQGNIVRLHEMGIYRIRKYQIIFDSKK